MILSKKLTLKTNGNGDTIDITPGVDTPSPKQTSLVPLLPCSSTAFVTGLSVQKYKSSYRSRESRWRIPARNCARSKRPGYIRGSNRIPAVGRRIPL